MKIPFAKMHGAGNSFLLLDDPDSEFPVTDSARIQTLCSANLGLGTEGLLLLRPPETPDTDFRMLFFNPDGSRAEMCGNGARCISYFALLRKRASTTQRFQTDAGFLRSEILSVDSDAQEAQVRVAMSALKDLHTNLTIPEAPSPVHFVNSGVPHAVVFVDDLAATPVDSLGRAIRYSAAFAPAGTNVDFVQILSPSKLLLRTYERGVEAESGACGTGAAASAYIAAQVRDCRFPIDVRVKFGDTLTIDLPSASSPTLSGPAKVICEGMLK